jgi:flagellar capping protein FliD
MSGSTFAMGKAIIDPSGKKPVRMGRKIDGFDPLEVAEQLKEATLAGVKKQSAAIEKNKTVVIPAISELQTKIQTLRSDAVALSNYLGVISTTPNAFKDLQATVVKSGEYTQSNYVDVTIDNRVAKATTNSMAIRIKQLATVDSRISSEYIKDQAATEITDATTALNLAGTFIINGIPITVVATESLNNIVSNINNAQASVQAQVIQDGSTSKFNLIINGTTLATALTFTDTDGLLATNFGINVAPLADLNEIKAKIEYDVKSGEDGLVTKTYYFDSNTVTGLIPGVTLKLLCPTLNSGATYDNLNISLTENSKVVVDKIVSLFKQYNELREVLNRNLMVDNEGNPLDPEASMLRSPLIKRLSEQLDTIFNATLVGGSSGDYFSWQDIGLEDDEAATGFQAGTYAIIDSNKLLSAITNNFEKVKKLFGNYPVVSNTDFRVWDLGPSLSDSIAGETITVTFKRTGDEYYAKFVCGTVDTGDVLQTSAYRLEGPADSVFQNISIGYSGNTLTDGQSKVFTLVATQGIADKVTKKLDSILDKTTGEFATEVRRVRQLNDKLKGQVEKAEKEAERIEKKWTAQAARLDAARTKYEQFSQQLENMFNSNKH